ncbi:MAG: hypothetical protein H0T73_01710 [Ardenticatenales bacterium]|nr:hypothetical protein [Ardenticatenales bacterium]
MKFKLIRPTLETPFHIDWAWFDRNHLNAESFVRGQLCYSCHQRFEKGLAVEEVDHIDPETGEVIRMDSLRESILAHCQMQPDYLAPDVPVMQAILRVFLANNNQPLTAVGLSQRLRRSDAETLLRLLTASGVQNGVVPVKL